MTQVSTVQHTIESIPDPKGASRNPNEISATEVRFQPQNLNVFDANLKRKSLSTSGSSENGALSLFKNPKGITADQLLTHPSFEDVTVVAGGMYFAEEIPPHRTVDALLWFRPDSRYNGRLIEGINDSYVGGGFLMVDADGGTSLARKTDFSYDQENDSVCMGQVCQDIGAYRLIAQSNVILVANGEEDNNFHGNISARSALVTYANNEMGIVNVSESITLAEFGHLLVKMGAKNAINLDGGPSVQMAQRSSQGIERLVGWENGNTPDRMPTLFTIE